MEKGDAWRGKGQTANGKRQRVDGPYLAQVFNLCLKPKEV